MKLRRKKKQWQKKQKKCMHYKNYKLLVHTINRVLFWNSQGFLGQTREYGVFEWMAGWLDGGLADCLDGSLIGLYGTTLPPSPPSSLLPQTYSFVGLSDWLPCCARLVGYCSITCTWSLVSYPPVLQWWFSMWYDCFLSIATFITPVLRKTVYVEDRLWKPKDTMTCWLARPMKMPVYIGLLKVYIPKFSRDYIHFSF